MTLLVIVLHSFVVYCFFALGVGAKMLLKCC